MENSNKTIYSLIVGCIILSAFIFAKSFEYRPIIVTNVTRALNTVYTPSSSRFVSVSISAQISSSLSLSGGQSGTINLQVSDNTGANYVTVATTTNNNTGSLTIGLNTVQTQAGDLVATVPPGCSYKLVSTGTSTFTAGAGQETQL